MPIHDLSYQHWAGEWTSHPYRWWVITRQGISLLAKKKSFLVLLFLALIPFLVRCVILYGAVVMGRIAIMKIDAAFFEGFLRWQLFPTFLITIYAGAGLIANDLKANALQIYLSKAITRRDYLIGKLGVAVFFAGLPTLIPALLLFLLAAAFHSSLEFLQQYSWVVLPIIGYSLIIIFVNALVMLALSSLNRSSRFAGIFAAAVVFFSMILESVLSALLRTGAVAWVSVKNDVVQIGDVLFGSPLSYPVSPWVCGLVLAFLMAGSTWIIHSRVRAVEVVK
ncbi:MAG: ABC transporter permease [Acidobacteriia bacterium]|nr:ABC transporter permease [Terriglobia bacterium]